MITTYVNSEGLDGVNYLPTVSNVSGRYLRGIHNIAYDKFDENEVEFNTVMGRIARSEPYLEHVAVIIRKDGKVIKTFRQFWEGFETQREGE